MGRVLTQRREQFALGPVDLVLDRHREVTRELAVRAERREVDDVAVEANPVRTVDLVDVLEDTQSERVAVVRVEVAAGQEGQLFLLLVQLVVGAVPGADVLVGVARQVLSACGLRDVPLDGLGVQRVVEACLALELCPHTVDEVD